MAVNGIVVDPVVQLIPREAIGDVFTADRMKPNDTQVTTLIIMGVLFALFLMYPFGRYILYPFEVSVSPSLGVFPLAWYLYRPAR
jgi:ABC-type enterochelin transport system permease subunit